jgi:D-serine dehydratase
MAGIEDIATELGGFELTASWRGVPPGVNPIVASNVATKQWRPADGAMSLPLLSLDLETYNDNKAAMLEVCRAFSCEIAPHAKTPMAPVLARDLVASGAWGASVADLRQADVMLRHGIRRILIANEIGGLFAANRLAALIAAYPDAEVYLFIDSTVILEALAARWKMDPKLPELRLLIEIGCGRGGTQSEQEVEALLGTFAGLGEPRLQIAGIAAYEGTANRPDEEELRTNLDDLFWSVSSAMEATRAAVGPNSSLVLSAGGSSLFDHVIVRCMSILEKDPKAFLVLRSGACFFSDHGLVRDRLRAIASRAMLGPSATARIAASFKPALRLWAEVLSVNSDGTCICGLGLRDVAHDQGPPVPLAVWRDGFRIDGLEGSATVVKLNDQHAFVHVRDKVMRIGDVLEFGIRHPCTTIDKHDLIYGLDGNGQVSAVMRTFFG